MKVKAALTQVGAYNPPLEMRVERDYLLLDFNESTQPPGDAVREAMRSYIEQGRMRVYPSYSRFMKALSAYAGVPEEQVIATNGSDSAIQLIVNTILEPGDEMILPMPGFIVTDLVARCAGAEVISPRYRGRELAFPYEEVLAAVTPRTRLIVVINPNNPTGTSPTLEQVEGLLQRHRDIAVMVDEAYYEFSGNTAAPLLARYDNLVITRTFSKAFALAGLRLGYALGSPAFVRELHKVRIPYDVNALAVVAAEASLANPAPWRSYVAEVMTQAKPMVERFFDEHGVDYVRGDANFMLVRPGDAGPAYEHLKAHGILVRPQRAPIADTFRMSVGTVTDMRRFMEVFSQYLSAGVAARHRA
jgi:histidinol-phosphate aminotransferase